jgi:hypothetical protein
VSFRVFAGTTGPSGFSGAGLDVALSFGARGFSASADPWLAVAGTQLRLSKLFPGAMSFQSVLSSPYPGTFSGADGRAQARAERARVATAEGMPSIDLREIAVSGLATGDILLTGQGGGAYFLRMLGADPDEHSYGHAALVLDIRGDRVIVFSADQHGAYRDDNDNSGVGGRSWAVIRPGPEVDRAAVVRFAESFPERQGLVGTQGAYLGGSGANVCSSLVARALEAGGATSVPRSHGDVITPGALRGYGALVGQVYVPSIRRPE